MPKSDFHVEQFNPMASFKTFRKNLAAQGADPIVQRNMKSLKPIEDCRGMSDPFFFSFNILDKGKVPNPRMLCHGVVFTSFFCDSDDKQIKICDIDDDPRMAHFVRFVYSNWLKKYSADTRAVIEKVEKEIVERAKQLVEIKAQIAELKKFHEQQSKPKS